MEVFRCGRCSKTFDKRMHYNRHRKVHDRPYPCRFCEKAFALKNDRNRHRLQHRATHSKLQCLWEGCDFDGTVRKDYLWKHMKERHLDVDNDKSEAERRELYEESVAVAKASEPKKLDYELLEAACDGDEKSVANLLQMGAQPYAKDKSDRPVTYLAARQGHEAVVTHLVKSGVDLEKTMLGKSMLFLAAEEGSVPATAMLLMHGANPNQGANQNDYNRPNLPIHIASANGHESVIRELSKYGALVDARSSFGSGSQTALRIAASHGHEKVVDQLIQMSANVNAEDRLGHTPLHTAASKGHVGVAARLLQEIENANAISTMLDPLGWTEKETPLHVSAQHGQEIMTRLLLDNGADINAKTKPYEATALHKAILFKKPKIVAILLERGAAVDARDTYKITPLHRAVEVKDIEMARLLLDAKAEVNAEDMDGETALHRAAKSRRVEMIQTLLDANANVNAEDRKGMTALHYAAGYRRSKYELAPRNEAVVKALLEAGAKVDLRDLVWQKASVTIRKWVAARVCTLVTSETRHENLSNDGIVSDKKIRVTEITSEVTGLPMGCLKDFQT